MFENIVLRRILAVSALALLIGGGLLLYRWPTTLTIAVGPQNSPITAYMKEITAALRNSKDKFRLRIVVTDGSEASSRLLDSGKVDLAIARSDDESSQVARALIILQRKTLFAIARKPAAKPAGKGQKLAKTGATITSDARPDEAPPTPGATATPIRKPNAGKRSGPSKKSAEPEKDEPEGNLLDVIARSRGALLRRLGTNDGPIVEEALAHYSLGDSAKKLRPMNRRQAEEAFRQKQIDLLVVLAHPSEPAIRRLVRQARGTLGKSFLLLGPPGAKGLAYQLKHLEVSTLPSGVFGGNPPIPEADLESVAVTYELVAHQRMNERTAAHLTKVLTDLRTQLRGTDDGEFAIELPSTEEARRYLPHAGTVAQINGESKTFLDQYSDIIWLSLFGIGLVGSAITSLLGWLGLRSRREGQP